LEIRRHADHRGASGATGELEYVNMRHVPPLLVCNKDGIRPPHGNLPVGLLSDATYESDHASLHAGDRLIW